MRTLLLFAFCLAAQLSYGIGAITGPTIVCSGSTITLSNVTPGGTWTSSDGTVATVGAASGVVTGTLVGATAGTATISYTDGVSVVMSTITVNPLPTLTSTHTPPPVCDSTLFIYTPTSAVAGTAFTWHRDYIPGIVSLSVTSTGTINERLDNSLNIDVPVTYIFTLTASGCTSTDSVKVRVAPTPTLLTALTATTCSNALFSYVPLTGSSLTTLAWSRAAVTGITPATAAGTGSISETLVNSTTGPLVVVYTYTMTILGCSNTNNVTVTVDPCINGVADKAAEHLSIHPNPSNGNFVVDIPFAVSDGALVTVTNVLGKIVYVGKSIKNKSSNIDLKPGIYLVSVKTETENMNTRVIVQ